MPIIHFTPGVKYEPGALKGRLGEQWYEGVEEDVSKGRLTSTENISEAKEYREYYDKLPRALQLLEDNVSALKGKTGTWPESVKKGLLGEDPTERYPEQAEAMKRVLAAGTPEVERMLSPVQQAISGLAAEKRGRFMWPSERAQQQGPDITSLMESLALPAAQQFAGSQLGQNIGRRAQESELGQLIGKGDIEGLRGYIGALPQQAYGGMRGAAEQAYGGLRGGAERAYGGLRGLLSGLF